MFCYCRACCQLFFPFKLCQQKLDLRPQRRQFRLDDCPDNIQVNAGVLVNKLVAHPCHVLPGNPRGSYTQNFGDAFGGLPENHQASHNCINCFTIPLERLKGNAVGEFRSLIDGRHYISPSSAAAKAAAELKKGIISICFVLSKLAWPWLSAEATGSAHLQRGVQYPIM